MSSASHSSNCPHVSAVADITWEEIQGLKRIETVCKSCSCKGPNLWLCLHMKCSYVGCGESAVDHSSSHAQRTEHCLSLNLSTMRIWCYGCEAEVFPNRNTPKLTIRERRQSSSLDGSPTKSSSPSTPNMEESEEDEEDEHIKPKGLTGLQNIGNTCYMNAALQSLSNCPPLTRFFLDCPGFVRTDKKPMLSKSYWKLMSEMWHRKRSGYVVPSSIAHGIKVVHPMFRGYTQQDTQEFLRCFMDQLHEELKQATPPPHRLQTNGCHDEDDEVSMTTTDSGHSNHPSASDRQSSLETSSQSDGEYETCDSGLSSERSSVEHNVSSDECGENGEIARSGIQTRNKSNNNRRVKREKNRIIPEESNLIEKESTSPSKSKEKKETTNMASKQETETRENGDHAEVTEVLDYADAMSDLEQGQIHRTRTLSARSRQSSESEKTNSSRSSHISQGPKKKKSVQYRSVISDIFDGKILSSVQCLTCERISSTKETFQDLSLPIPSKDHLHLLQAQQQSGSAKGGTCGEVNLNQGWVTWMFGWMKSWFWGPTIALQNCLAAFFSADELKGDNMYSCEKCKKLRNGVKYSKVLELPEILCIHLKRFRHEFMFSTKISSYVSFPLEGLDMGPYLHKDNTSQVTQYDLVAVICHHGTAGGGHYTAYGLNALNDQWYEFDDQYVTEVDVQQVENCEAYVLFYRKKTESMAAIRDQAAEMMDSREASLMQFYVSKQWMNRFLTFAEPGPITNSDFLCRHAGVPPYQMSYVDELVTTVPQPVWEMLHEQFGGGPAINHLYPCKTCTQEIEKLNKRQKYEMDTFVKLNSDFQNEENPSIIYAISMAWFKEWENFVRGREDDPPGPIENSKISMMKAGSPVVKMSSDYGQLSEEMWRFLHDIYAGGPELILKQTLLSHTTEGGKSGESLEGSKPQ